MNPTTADSTARALVAKWGRKVRSERIAQGVTQIVFARAIESSQPALSRVERGEVEPPLDLRLRIAAALGTTHEALFGVSEDA